MINNYFGTSGGLKTISYHFCFVNLFASKIVFSSFLILEFQQRLENNIIQIQVQQIFGKYSTINILTRFIL